jgi:hypothetical protein
MDMPRFDPRRDLLCGRANAERLALRMSEETGEGHAVFRTGSALQPLRVMRVACGKADQMELQVIVL